MVSDDWEMRDVVMGLCDGREEMSLGFTQEGRRKVIHKKQYLVKPGTMSYYYKTLKPFMDAGIFEETSSPHNDPVSLVLKQAATEKKMQHLEWS